MKLNREEIQRIYDYLQLNSIEEYFRNIEQKINDVVNTVSFSGSAAGGMKAYLKEVHGLAIKSFIILIMELDAGLKNFLDTMEQVDKDENAILDRNLLDELYDVAEKHIRKMKHHYEDFNSEIYQAKNIMDLPSYRFVNAMEELERYLENGKRIAEETSEQMQSFNDYHMRELGSIEAHLNILEQVLNQITGILSGNMSDFKVGNFAQSELGQTLFAHTVNATFSISRKGRPQEAMEALALIGGYMSTLPEETRQELFQVKGRALASAYIGDPVNAATWNFSFVMIPTLHLALSIEKEEKSRFGLIMIRFKYVFSQQEFRWG
jgi:hypothetical protein